MMGICARILIIIIALTQAVYAADDPIDTTVGYRLISSKDITHVNDILRSSIKTLIPDNKETYMEYNSPEAKEYIEKLGISFIPYVIYDKRITESRNFFHMAKKDMIEKTQDYYVIPEKQLKMGEVMLLSRQKKPEKLTVYSMSMCPYAKDALLFIINAVRKDVLNMDVTVKYIVNYNEFGIQSSRGTEELKENIRQIVIQDIYPKSFFDYILLRQDKSPEEALALLGITVQDIESNKEHALKRLKEDFDETSSLGINRSPTFLLENIYLIPSIDILRKHGLFAESSPEQKKP